MLINIQDKNTLSNNNNNNNNKSLYCSPYLLASPSYTLSGIFTGLGDYFTHSLIKASNGKI